MKWGSTAASGSGLHAFQPSMSLEAGSRGVHVHFSSSMHLLVPGAYRHGGAAPPDASPGGLNAPSGAGCLPTHSVATPEAGRSGVSMHLLVPGAYQLRRLRHRIPRPSVSMHLLVPGAYRLGYRNSEHTAEMSLNAPSGAGCLPTEGPWDPATDKKRSQCTF